MFHEAAIYGDILPLPRTSLVGPLTPEQMRAQTQPELSLLRRIWQRDQQAFLEHYLRISPPLDPREPPQLTAVRAGLRMHILTGGRPPRWIRSFVAYVHACRRDAHFARLADERERLAAERRKLGPVPLPESPPRAADRIALDDRTLYDSGCGGPPAAAARAAPHCEWAAV